MKKWKVIWGIIISAFLLGIIIYSCMDESVLKEILIVVISLLAAVAALLQMQKNTALTTGGFILNLQEVYNGNSDFLLIFLSCWEDFKGEERQCDLSEKRESIINYLTFFESIYIMMQEGCLNIQLLDELFGRRFFMVVNNKTVQDMELAVNSEYYTNIYKLYDIWKAYRIKQEKKEQKKNCRYTDALIHCYNENYKDLFDHINVK